MSRIVLFILLGQLFAIHGAVAQSTPSTPTPSPTPPKAETPAEVQEALKVFQGGKEDDFRKAEEILEKVCKTNPELKPAKIILADWFSQARQGSNARVMLERAATADPLHPDVLLQNASFAFREGRITDALLNCLAAEQGAKLNRWNPAQRARFLREARIGAATAHESRGHFDAAEEALRGIINDDPRNGAVRQRLAAVLFQTGKYEGARNELNEAFKAEPNLDPPEIRMALLWNAKKDAQGAPDKEGRIKAEEFFKLAVREHKNAKCLRAYASFLLEEGNPEGAALYISEAIKLEPNARENLLLEGVKLRMQKQYPAAESKFEELKKLAENDGYTIENLALVLAESSEKSKRERAIQLAGNLVTLSNKSTESLYVIGWCYFKNGQTDNAQLAFAEAVKTSTQIPTLDCGYFLARVQFEKGDFADCKKNLEKIVTARGIFVHRKDAEKLLSEADSKTPKTPAPK